MKRVRNQHDVPWDGTKGDIEFQFQNVSFTFCVIAAVNIIRAFNLMIKYFREEMQTIAEI